MKTWRSMLFVPAAARQRWEKAHTRGADAIIVDLEDSTQPEAKAAARLQATDAVRTLYANGAIVTVRVNNDAQHLADDLEAVVHPGLAAIVLPKTEQAGDLESLSAMLDALEYERGMDRNTIRTIGSEDFALSIGRPPAPLSLGLAAQTIAYAASARGLMGIGMATGIANFTDLDAFAKEAQRSHAMGLTGAMCIHPNQVAVLNQCFGASEEQLAEARAILAAWEGRTDGVVSHNGRMIDQPVVERARRLLSSAGLA
jgi:citrate lyase subunit beta/citryl-CoA lyase